MAGFLARTRHDPRAETAFRLAAAWGSSQAINGLGSLGHAVNVANTLGRHTPDAPPQVVAACLLHAIPRWPMTDEDVHELVEAQCGVEARLLLEALRAEQTVLAKPSDLAVDGHLRLLRTMPWLAHATLAFKIVTFQYTSGRTAHGCQSIAAWRPLDNQVSYLRQLHDLAVEVVPQTMSGAYLGLLEQCLPVITATASR
ncbi:hypothetical protein [Streptomyces sp. SAI-090]|uniref:hypothetical protein n=1 Tax=Streptomyces sp. SAI-090 TaxID=2940545 RepID=UPI0024758B2A|nr:hypothetical protein [Streptomyces sp. SAI-090]MDH6522362.1 hypothetical protein [Streptomyces sp. SAI-090]